MKTYLKDYNLSVERVEEAIYDCLRRKWKRTDVSYFLAEYHKKPCDNLHKVAKECKKIASNKDTRHLLKDTIHKAAESIYLEIKERRIELQPIEYQYRYDHASQKLREVGISSIKQQVYDYIAINACRKMLFAKIGYYQCASIPGRGQIFGKKAIEKWIRKNPKDTRFFYKCDIRKYYPSVNIRKLKRLLRRDIRNQDILYVIYYLLGTYKAGLCIGSYLSQFLANYFLSYAYHFITENSYVIRVKKTGERIRINCVKKALFYMDDIILFSSSLKLLKKAIRDFCAYIQDTLFLEIKAGSQFAETSTTRIDMMGYVISIKNTIIRKRIYKKVFRSFLRVHRNKFYHSLYLARRTLSFYGYIKNSDLYQFVDRFHIQDTVNKLRKVVSQYDKKRIYRETGNLQLLSAA